MTFMYIVRKSFESVKYRRSADESGGNNDSEEPDPHSGKGFSEFTLEVDFPTIAISQNTSGNTFNPKSSYSVDMGLTPTNLARLTNIERKIDDIQQSIWNLSELSDTNQISLKEHQASIIDMEIKLKDMTTTYRDYSNVNNKLRELSGLYDLISLECNPFIETENDIGIRNNSEKPAGNSTGTPEIHILEWLEFLLARISLSGIPTLLDYYQEIGWIENGLKETALKYLNGMKLEEAVEGSSEDWKLTPEDQSRSLKYIHLISGVM